MSEIKELLEDKPKRQEVRTLVYTNISKFYTNPKLTIGNIENIINCIIDIAVKEAKESTDE